MKLQGHVLYDSSEMKARESDRDITRVKHFFLLFMTIFVCLTNFSLQ